MSDPGIGSPAGDRQPGTFVLGLTMAGAISGGAYTAGVLSFLAEALDDWEARRGQPGVPDHRVVLKAISGASAGSICGALGAISLLERPGTPVGGTTLNGRPVAIPRALPRLYAAWVEGPCLVHPDKWQQGLLGTRDLKKRQDGTLPPVTSALDSTRLDDVARQGTAPMPGAEPWRRWVDGQLHLFMTHTDMRGVPFRIGFLADGKGDHGMLSHADRVHYMLAGGTASPPVFSNDWLNDDESRIELDLPGLLQEPARPPAIAALAEATLASSAFPVGFSARLLDHGPGSWTRRPMPMEIPPYPGQMPWLVLRADWEAPWPGDPARTVVWDGGCLDNEPFQYARWAIMAAPPHGNPRDPKSADRTVLMIDPFPEPPGMPAWGVGRVEPDLLAVLARAPGMFVNAARFKPDEIAAALDPAVRSRLLIAPRRDLLDATGAKVKDDKGKDIMLRGGAALASGGLGGFGGTMAESFRLHDFQLGRRNAQRFLQRYLTLPPDNEVVWGRILPTERVTREDGSVEAPVVPLSGALAEPIPPLAWPRLGMAAFEDLVEQAEWRLDAVVARLIANLGGATQRTIAKLAWSSFGRGKAVTMLRWTLFRDLLARDQIEGSWGGAPGLQRAGHEERAVMWVLADPAHDAWTEDALLRALPKAPVLHSPAPVDLKPAALSGLLRRIASQGWVEELPGRPGTWLLPPRAPGMLKLLRGAVSVAK